MSPEDLLRDLHSFLFDPVVWLHKGDPQENFPQVGWFCDVWVEDDDTVEEDVLSEAAKRAADAAGVPHGAATQVFARVERQRLQDGALLEALLKDVYPNPDPAPFNRDVTEAPLKLDFSALQELAKAKGKREREEKREEKQKKKREREEKKKKKREETQQRERETQQYIERMQAEEKATRDAKLANLEEDPEVKQSLRGLLQRLLKTIPNGLLQDAIRPSMRSISTLNKLCDEYRVDKSGLHVRGVFAELQSVYNSL